MVLNHDIFGTFSGDFQATGRASGPPFSCYREASGRHQGVINRLPGPPILPHVRAHKIKISSNLKISITIEKGEALNYRSMLILSVTSDCLDYRGSERRGDPP